MSEIPEARSVTLSKVRAFAPSFHEHIARSKLRGSICRPGDLVVVYEVVCTEPEGPVVVGDNTVIQFVSPP